MQQATVFIPDSMHSEHVCTMLDELVRFYQQMQSVGMEQTITFTAKDCTKTCEYEGDGVINVTLSGGDQLTFDDHGHYENLGAMVHEHCERLWVKRRATELCEALETSAPQYAEFDKRTMSMFELIWRQRNPGKSLVLYGRNDDTSDAFTGYIDWKR